MISYIFLFVAYSGLGEKVREDADQLQQHPGEVGADHADDDRQEAQRDHPRRHREVTERFVCEFSLLHAALSFRRRPRLDTERRATASIGPSVSNSWRCVSVSLRRTAEPERVRETITSRWSGLPCARFTRP